jgi:hypothetical protein
LNQKNNEGGCGKISQQWLKSGLRNMVLELKIKRNNMAKKCKKKKK